MLTDIFLETARLRLRRFTPADEDSLVALDSDPEVMRYLNGGIPTPREVIAATVLPGFLASYDRVPGFGVWAAEESASGAFLGWCSFRTRTGVAPMEEVRLGYRLRRAVWGQGLATEGARALLHQGFTALGVGRVAASTYEYNRASRRVMEKLGMRHVRSFRPTPDDLARTDTFAPDAGEVWDGDEVEYAITRDEWEQHAPTIPPCPPRTNRTS